MSSITFTYKISETEHLEGPFENKFFLLSHSGEARCGFIQDLVYNPFGLGSIIKNCDSCNRIIDLSGKYLTSIMEILIKKHDSVEAIVS